MKKRVNRLRGKIERHRGLDVLVTHAPLHGYGDMNDLAHRGFTVFRDLLDRYHPQPDAARPYTYELRSQHPAGVPVRFHPHCKLL